MSLLMISTDRGLLDPNSRVSERFRQYATIFEKLDVIVFATGAHETVQLTPNVTIYPTNSSDRFRYFADAKRLSRQFAPTIVSAQDPFLTGYTAYKIAQIHDAFLHVQVHTDIFSTAFKQHSLKNFFFVWLAKRIIPKADAVRVVSERIARSLDRLHLKAKPVVLPIQVTLPNAVEPFSFPYAQTIVTVSRLEPEKNVGLTIDAFAIVRKTHPDVGLVIVGDGSQRKELERKVAFLGLADAVQFMGGQVDVFSAYAGADIYMQTSAYEGYGMALIEAALSGLPVVTTDVGVVGEVLVDGGSCLVAQQRPVDVAAKLAILLDEEDLRTQIAGRAQEMAQKHVREYSDYLERYKDAFTVKVKVDV